MSVDRPSFATRPRTPPRPPPYGAMAVVLLIGAVLMVRSWFEPVLPAGALVTVVGAVPRPGVHQVVGPLTVRAAVEAAGGAAVALPDTPIFPGDEVVVGLDGVHVAPSGNPLLVGLPIDLNAASAEALIALPGVGPTLAARIVEDRDRRGPFRSVADADRVKGIGPATIAKWSGRAVVGGAQEPPR